MALYNSVFGDMTILCHLSKRWTTSNSSGKLFTFFNLQWLVKKSLIPFYCVSQFDYYNSMLINTMDEDGNYVELGGEFSLEENEHFNNLPVNTQQSNIQVPTNVYNKGC